VTDGRLGERGLLGRVAGAPITWGVCEVPGWGHQLGPKRVLAEMARIGLRATELGPEGYLPAEPDPLRQALAAHDLRLVGGFVTAVLHRDPRTEELARAARSADILAAAGAQVLVLAASTGETGYEGSLELDAREWSSLARGVGDVMELGAQRGLEVALHPHHGTAIEAPNQLARLLESSPVSLCVDTGHLLLGGADPVEVTRNALGRIAHVHLKDVAAHLAEQVRRGRVGYREAVRRGLYRTLGAGDVDIAEIVRLLERSGYRGWYVLEQDAVLEEEPRERGGPIRDAEASLAYLRRVTEEIEAEAVTQGVANGRREAAR
jgi:inosose dehydratase